MGRRDDPLCGQAVALSLDNLVYFFGELDTVSFNCYFYVTLCSLYISSKYVHKLIWNYLCIHLTALFLIYIEFDAISHPHVYNLLRDFSKGGTTASLTSFWPVYGKFILTKFEASLWQASCHLFEESKAERVSVWQDSDNQSFTCNCYVLMNQVIEIWCRFKINCLSSCVIWYRLSGVGSCWRCIDVSYDLLYPMISYYSSYIFQ